MRHLINYRSAPAKQAATWAATWRWAAAGLLAAAIGGAAWTASRPGGHAADAAFVPVERGEFVVSLEQQGELQAINNVDVVCPVPGQNTLRFIVPEGTLARKGERLFEFDDSQIRQGVEKAQLDVRRAESDLTAAREGRAIGLAKGAADVRTAEVELGLAELSLAEYERGEYPKLKGTAERELRTAEGELADKDEYALQTRVLYGKGFTTATELKKAQIEAQNKREAVAEKRTALEVLTTYTHRRESADKANKVSEAKSKLETAKASAASDATQKAAAEAAAEQSLTILREALTRSRKNLADCTVLAPGAGIVLYSTSLGYYFGTDQPLGPGSKVMEQQLVVRLPDVSAMKAVVKVEERAAVALRQAIGKATGKATAGRGGAAPPLRAVVRIVGVEEPVGASVTRVGVLPDGEMRYVNPDLKQYPVDLTLDRTPAGLKPGAGVSATITLDRVPDAVSVPFAAVYSAGEKAWVFVRQPTGRAGGLEAREVKLGRRNASRVQVLANLRAGEQVRLLGPGDGPDLLKRSAAPPPA